MVKNEFAEDRAEIASVRRFMICSFCVLDQSNPQNLRETSTVRRLLYMRVTGKQAGLLINFNVPRLMDGAKRLISPAFKP